MHPPTHTHTHEESLCYSRNQPAHFRDSDTVRVCVRCWMISQPSTRHHRSAEEASHKFSSLFFAETTNTAMERRPAPQGPVGDGLPSFKASLSSSTSSATADIQTHATAAQPDSVPSRSNTVWKPTRSPTIRPPPSAALPGHLLRRHSHLLSPSSEGMAASRRADAGRLQASAAASLESAQESGETTTHSSTPPPYALVMDSLVRRYRAEEDRLRQWRQGGGRAPIAAALRHSGVQSQSRQGDSIEEEGITHVGLRGSMGGVSSGHRSRGADGGLRGKFTRSVQRTALARAVQAWWRSRRALQRMKSKASRRLYPTTLSVSSAAVSGAETQHLRHMATALVSSAPAAPPGLSLSWIGRAGHSILGCISQSLSLSSDRGQSTRLELLRRADAAQLRGAHRGDYGNPVYDSLVEDQQSSGTERAEMTAETVSTGVVAPVMPLSRTEGETVLAHPRRRVLQQTAAGARSGALHRQLAVSGRLIDGEADLRISSVSSTCSSRGSNVSGEGREAIQSIEPVDDLSHRQEAGSVGWHEDKGSFILSWIHAPRMHFSDSGEAASSDDADSSFRNVSRLFAQSRMRFARWLHRQKRLKAAKRSLRGVRTWSKPTAADAEHRDAFLGARYSSATPTPFSAASELHRCAAQAAPSPWESALPHTWGDWDDSDEVLRDGEVTDGVTAAAKRPTRAHILEKRRAAIAAGAAASNAAQERLVERETMSEVQTSVDEAPALSLAAQRTRQHADDLARLTESLAMLTLLRERSPAGAGNGIHAHRANSPQGVDRAPPMMVGQEQNAVAVPSHPSVTKVANSALPTWSPSRAHASSIISAGQHRRSYHGSAREAHGAESRTCDGWCCKHAVEKEAGVGAFHSLLTDTTHTQHDLAVRAVYESIMSEVCTCLVQRDVENAIDVSCSAADRALTQWIERQLMLELTQPRSRERQTTAEDRDSAAYSATTLQPLVCTGVTQHIRSGVPVSLEHLRLDDVDRQALASVYARGSSNAIAVKFDTEGYEISYRQLASLSPQSWLNDQVVNNYLQLLCLEAEGAATASFPVAQCRHRIASLGTHFYTKVESEFRQRLGGFSGLPPRLPQLDSSSAIFRWLRNRKHLLEPYTSSDPRSVRVVLVPVNIEGQHWALAVFHCADNRWVMYDSMSRSERARQRGAVILAHLSHAWCECQRHFGFIRTEDTTAATATTDARYSPSSGVLQPSPWASACVVAAPYVPFTDTLMMEGHSTVVSPLDSLQPYGSLDHLHRAAKRMRHQEELFAEQAGQRKLQRASDSGGGDWGAGVIRSASAATVSLPPPLSKTAATTLPAEQLSDREVEWFTGGFDHIPQQANSNDCGVFVCQVAWCVAQGVAVSFTQSDVTRLREVILLELLNKKLLRRYPTANTSSSAGV
ncbi:putative cysteine peptidase [Leishmania braziliensis MHOM/BR/75/M2904]|uniref:Cysteine peptidase n=2 Tax=Leishmania braziliensis TaxID=5660 RepID=A4HF51_LEIBR|nr:putative cysteine peptidase [Leishmania braziliensis MHOM/BR/75/M2904]CAJ2474866.1 unnamed protein product [Leishmania braziliensis]CAM39461.2 putative cysteine peptidase [Leishmania braziliensis MHOM/BR/75/M2904]SYZ66868.1 SUMO1/Ulp2 [Leishmania braziliensis MHOM/BR/75/M2904]